MTPYRLRTLELKFDFQFLRRRHRRYKKSGSPGTTLKNFKQESKTNSGKKVQNQMNLKVVLA